MLCLSLAACGEGENSGGELDNIYAFEVVESIEAQSYVKAIERLMEMTNSQEGGTGATALAEQFPNQKEVLGWMEAGEYEKVAGRINELQIRQLKNDGSLANIDWNLVEECYGKWEPEAQQPVETMLGALELNKDGNIQYEGKTGYWLIENININDAVLDVYIIVYHADGSNRSILMSNWIVSGRLQLCVQYDSYGLNYTKGSEVQGIFGEWTGLTNTDSLVLDEFGGLRLNNVDYTFEVISSQEDTKVLRAKDAGLEITVTKRGDYQLMTVKYADGSENLFYQQQAGYDENWPEVLYHDALKLLRLWQEDKTDYLGWNDQYYTRQEVLHMAYTKLVGCKGHADAADYIKRFTVKKDVLLRIENPRPTTEDHETYMYDDNGRLVQFCGVYKELERLTFEEYGNTVYRMTYDSKDRVKTISWEAWTFHYDQLKKVQCSATYNYNNQGRVQQIDLQLKDDTCRVEYLYDLNGTLWQMHYEFGSVVSDQEEGFFRDFYYLWATPEEGLVIGDYWDLPRSTGTVNYSYDTMGNVIEESWAIDRKNVGEAPTLTANITRTYDSEGRLIKKVYTDIHGDTRTTEYTYDSAGKLSYAVETGDNLSVDKIEYNYVYANIYTFK
jgi:YD repeat-containing protein